MSRLFLITLGFGVIGIFCGEILAQSLTRGPYLQRSSANQATVRWRTSTATDSVVQYGTSPGTLDQTANSPGSRTEHIITVSGLSAATTYYYSVGDSAGPLAQGSDYYFVTHPVAGQAQATRVWVLGDSGTANASAAAVRDAYVNYNGSAHADLLLMLGDNAYPNGTDAEYQAAVFNMYPATLRNTILWPTLGNHDGQSADSATQSGPYYDMFTLPAGAESGGVPSGTEAYYAFDYANIHFVCLESYETNRSSTGAMANWLRNDLAATTQEWIIAFFHHPPYTKGSHNSDTEIELIEMRQNFGPILEDYGVDLVLTGHSHSYERSMLIDGHYGTSGTWNPVTMLKQGGTGDPGGAGGPYTKDAMPHDGAVYAVAGSSGQTSGGTLNHPVMITNLNVLGSMILDVNGNQMDGRFIDSVSSVRDLFRIVHNLPPSVPAAPTALAVTDITSSSISLAWTDNANNEDGFVLERSPDQTSWVQAAQLGVDVTAHTDTGLDDSTTYYYRVSAYNGAGSSAFSNVVSSTTAAPPPSIDQYASAETPVAGTVSGTFTNTHADDAVTESITEVESGGNPSKRHSLLEHHWQITTQPGAAVTLIANAWSSGSTDGDTFRFDYSLDNGVNWTVAFVVSGTDPSGVLSVPLPATANGIVLVRVQDTDRMQGNRELNTVFVDQLFIHTETTPGPPPAAPTGLSATATGTNSISLAWTDNAVDELGHQVERLISGAQQWTQIGLAAANATSFNDTSASANSTYSYRVRSYNTSGSSDYSNIATATTPVGITLSAASRKEKGVAMVALSWAGASSANVDVYRNGQKIATVANTGGYTDNTGQKGTLTFVYRVCEENNPAQCSNDVTVTF
jgi:hypothetical protein